MKQEKFNQSQILEKEELLLFFQELKQDLYSLLQKDLVFLNLYELCSSTLNVSNKKIVTFNSKYCHGGRFAFPYGDQNSLVVQNAAIYFSDFYTLLFDNYFQGKLKVHPSTTSLVDHANDVIYEFINIETFRLSPYVSSYKNKLSSLQSAETLEAFKWKYSDFITSAVLRNLEFLYDQGILHFKQKRSFNFAR